VDFYILPDVDLDAQRRFACRLAYKALSSGARVHVHVDDANAAAELDTLMWEYPAEQYLPHARSGDVASDIAPVVISYEEPPIGTDEVLINLAGAIPIFFGRFERVAEIIVAPQRDLGRDRYRYYRGHGYPLYDHTLEHWED
jgi:DNA polymerase-3 subunit chi